MAVWADLDDSDDEEEEALICSRHMTGDPTKFSQLTLQNGGSVKFGDNSNGSVIGKGTTGSLDSMVIEEVMLVTKLKHNLLSISQLCDKGYATTF
ncbi:hypothetical protein MLD38_035428 [Melastoma candidum]|uniref:Uncharacterized protein n=1 Tax=Melastoma candidum TaxID=119954 RepID=A0ACB9LG82_9MYRT|nr:hypothetical protein MLD38_035428 [Melastoma candidum]